VAKTRAQRKAERRKREARQARQPGAERDAESSAQHLTQVPETADVLEAELAEQGADIDALRGEVEAPPAVEAPPELEAAPEPEPQELTAPAPSRADVGRPEVADDKISRRARRADKKERKRRQREFEQRQKPTGEAQERQRGAVTGFLVSCWAELKRVQWPDRETLIQASAVTLLFIAVAAAYLGALDAIFNWIVQRVL
jgi:preprotein translocase SecE subunit